MATIGLLRETVARHGIEVYYFQRKPAEESNPDVSGVHPLKNVDLDRTLSSCANDEWDDTVQIPISALPSYSNCATDNEKTCFE
ncbi:unnamed protein product [Schistosoma margrebowiei]|uniref:Uncharacterized protein n=1 Tax=Schistosoma margrebowiei TaxID=48269 RepID=A0A183MRT1_9TREM|nr:unnamed protein product [Schistosoma margrebowiei]